MSPRTSSQIKERNAHVSHVAASLTLSLIVGAKVFLATQDAFQLSTLSRLPQSSSRILSPTAITDKSQPDRVP